MSQQDTAANPVGWVTRHPRHTPHDEDSDEADESVHQRTSTNLGQHEIPCKCKEYAQAEYLKRMLPTQDQ